MRLLLLALLLAAPAWAQAPVTLSALEDGPVVVSLAVEDAPQMVTVTVREPVYTTVKVCHGTYCTLEKRLAGYRTVTKQVPAKAAPKPPAAPRRVASRPCGCPANCDGFHCKSYPGTTCRRGDAAGCNCHGTRR